MSEIYVCVGCIGSPHGIHGATRLISYTQKPEDLLALRSFMTKEGDPFMEVVSLLRAEKPHVFVVKLKGVTSRTQSEALTNKRLYVSRKCFPDLEPDTFYHQDLMGFSVLNENKKKCGKLIGIRNFGAGDCLDILLNSHKQSMLVPFRSMWVPEVNLEEKTVSVALKAWNESQVE